MKKRLTFLVIVTGFALINCEAQDSLQIAEDFKEIIRLIRTDSLSKLAGLINYPLMRPNPIPDILTIKDFVSYAPILFDSSFKMKLLSYDDSVIFYHNGYYGLVGGRFHGDIWIDEDGRIESVNSHSMGELELQKKMTKEIKSKIYPSVNSLKKNILVCESDKFLIRVVLLDDNKLRYVA